MDLEESSKSRPKVEKEEEGNLTPPTLSPSKEITAIINGDNSPEDSLDFFVESGVPDGIGNRVSAIVSPEAVEKDVCDGIEMNEAENSTLRSSQSPSSSVEAVGFKLALKGHGLRKWRRVRRDSNKDGTSSADSAQFLKRRLPITESTGTREESKMKSVVEAEAADLERNADMTSLPISTGVLDPELEVLAGTGFSIGLDSDNSEDPSSKSSMVVSAPRLRHEAHGFGRERVRVKNFSGRGSSQMLQRHGQWRGGAVDTSKKFREDHVRFEKENSHSSAESDFRSSAAGVLRRGSVVSSNGIHSDRPLTFGGDHSDESQTGGEIRSGYCKENVEMKSLTRDGLHDELLEEDAQDSENCHPPSDLDPFMESIMLLQEAHKSLENEIQKIGAIGKEPMFDDIQLDGTEASNSPTVDDKESHRRVEHLDSLLDEASSTIKAKEFELEAVLGKACLPSMEIRSTDHLFLQEHQDEMESQLEALVKKTMEVEIEYLILTRTSQNWKILAEDHIALLKEQRFTDHEQMMLNHRNLKERIVKLKDESEKLETLCEGLLGTEKVLVLQNKICKFSLYYFVQLLLLCIAFWSFLMQLSSQPNEFVPT